MTKSELIQRLAIKNPHLPFSKIEDIVDTVFNEITEALTRNDRVELRGIGSFFNKHRTQRIGRNPRTGESVSVKQKYTPFFKTGKRLKERINS